MAGTDLRNGSASDNVENVLTIDSGGNPGNGIGGDVVILEGRIAGKTGGGVGDRTGTFSIDLAPFIANIDGDNVYEVHAHMYNIGINYNVYAKFILFGHTKTAQKVYRANETDSSTWEINNGVISRSGGGGRNYQVRIKKIM